MTENKPNTSSIFHTDFLPFAIRWGRGLSLFGIVLAFGPCLGLAVICWFLGQTFPIIGGPVFGILAGMIITLLLKNKSMFQDGITFVSKKVLQYAVILLGFGLNLSVILETGKQSLPIIVTTISPFSFVRM